MDIIKSGESQQEYAENPKNIEYKIVESGFVYE